jgi:hypothetical protein
MNTREYLKHQVDILPENILETIREFILFQRFNNNMFCSDTEYLESIPGMIESIQEGSATPLDECLDNVGWDIN